MYECIVRVFHLAWVIIIDGIRRHALIGLISFALASEAFGLLFFDFIPRDIGRASNDFLFSISWMTGLIFLFFHAVPAVAWGEDRRVIHTFLARPISRKEYLFGVFVGLALLLLALNCILGGIGWVILINIKDSVGPDYFQHLSLIVFLLSTLGLYCIELNILAVIMLISGTIRGSFPVFLLTLSYYFICSGLPVVREALGSMPVEKTDQGLFILLKWMTAIFPDFSRLDFKPLVTVLDSSLQGIELGSLFGVSLLYCLVVLWLASLLYQRRDLK